ncbi:SAM-dependent methyltransferase, partial [Bordetella pertussis]
MRNNVGHGPPGFLDAGVRPMALITSCLPAPVGGTA